MMHQFAEIKLTEVNPVDDLDEVLLDKLMRTGNEGHCRDSSSGDTFFLAFHVQLWSSGSI